MIKENIFRIRERISLICSKINCQPQLVTIVAVGKGRLTGQIKEAIEAGITDIGENRIQEAGLKYNDLKPAVYSLKSIKWHMVGRLQTNKVKDAVRIFDLIHSVDSLSLAQEINKRAAKINKTQDILIEIKTSGEATKLGLSPSEAFEVIGQIFELKNIKIKGLMTIAPLVDNPSETRPYFRRLKELLEEINTKRPKQDALSILSMGMTDDFEIAIEEGSNMIRLGRAIFGV